MPRRELHVVSVPHRSAARTVAPAPAGSRAAVEAWGPRASPGARPALRAARQVAALPAEESAVQRGRRRRPARGRAARFHRPTRGRQVRWARRQTLRGTLAQRTGQPTPPTVWKTSDPGRTGHRYRARMARALVAARSVGMDASARSTVAAGPRRTSRRASQGTALMASVTRSRPSPRSSTSSAG